MKTMKRAFSFVMIIALMLSFAFTGILSNAVSVQAATISTGSTITIKGFVSEGTLNSVISVPKDTNSNTTITIKDPHGKLVTDFEEETSEYIKFIPTKLGYYTVQYTNGFTKSQVYTIKITGTMPTIEFEENAEIYIPETIGSSHSVILPSPIITKANGEKLTYTLKHNKDTSASTNDVVVSVKSPLSTNEVVLTYNSDGKVVFTPIKDADENYIYGTYTVRYSYQDDNGITVTKSVEIKVEENFEDIVNNINMTFVWKNNDSIPTSGNLGEELVLPTPVAQDKNRANQEIQSYVDIKVWFVNADGEKEYTVDKANFSFKPMDKTENGAYYKVQYTIKNYFNKGTITKTYEIKNVKDNSAPDVYIVNSYTTEQVTNKTIDLTDARYLIPNRIIHSYDGEIIIPAIYAVDNFVSYDNLTLKRYFKTSDRTVLLDNDTYPANKNLVLKVDAEGMDEYVNECLKKAGTYTIRYEASDGTNSSKYIDIDFVVLDRDNDAMDTLAPEISSISISKTVNAGDKISFKAPTIKDYTLVTTDGTSQKITGQQYCRVEVGYYVGSNYSSFIADFKAGKDIQSYIDSDNYYEIEKDKDDSNYYSFNAPTSADGDKIYIVIRAFDNARFGAANSSTIAVNNVAVKEAQVRLLNIDPATVNPPIFDHKIKSEGEFSQNELIDICELFNKNIVFTGANADFMKISVNVYDSNDKEISVRSKNVVQTSTSATLTSAKFTTTRNGYYTIVITATDIANNSVIVGYQIYVNDTIPPVINEKDTFPTQVTVGQTIELPSIIVLDNGEEIVNQAEQEITFDGFDNPSYDFTPGDNKFVAYEIGTYTLKYVAYDGANRVELTRTIEAVADTTLKFDDNASISSYWEPQPLVKLDDDTYEKIFIPYITVSKDGNLNVEIQNYEVTITGPNGKTMSKTEVANGFEFEPSAADGVYTITYKAIEKITGQPVTLEKKITIGDTQNPTLVIGNEATNLPTSAKLNGSIIIDADDIEYSDAVSGKANTTLTITIKDTDGNVNTLTKDNGKYTYTFEKAGSYTLTYTATDKAGNTATKTSTIVVKAEGSTEQDITTIWGIVLIVISIAFLLGVVVYFVVTNKKYAPSKEKARQNAKIIE